MSPEDAFSKIIDIKHWDYPAIFYSIVAAMLVWFISRGFSSLQHPLAAIGRLRAIHRYRAKLSRECANLLVVGRRIGVPLEQSYVALDLETSDIANEAKLQLRSAFARTLLSGREAAVILGAPGAGKSTFVKYLSRRALQRGRPIPFFMRLRDMSPGRPVQESLSRRLEDVGLVDAAQFVDRELAAEGCLCVLDGLDEVRPELRKEMLKIINAFYKDYFCDGGGTLIVTCRKEAYRDVPLDIPRILEVRPMSDQLMGEFIDRWPLAFPPGKTKAKFWKELTASSKIHELARSPLLLVAALLQYSESNLGIPNERYQFLNRVASWLVQDWNATQGHPPDPLRSLYNRILPRLAFELHRRNETSLPVGDVEKLVADWLPLFGGSEQKPTLILEAIRARTGILVAEADGLVVFSHFGLQEYFASLELPEQVGASGIKDLAPLDWWREPLLLGIARLPDPTLFLESLFERDVALAVTAVAECPTPSTVLQARAVDEAINLVAGAARSVESALPVLLRKVSAAPSLEERLCTGLAQFLSGDSDRARLVGQALAAAGTEAATRELARRPEVWELCLEGTKVLSDDFETLLVTWVKKGDAAQSEAAAELLASRVSRGGLGKLVGILTELDTERAEMLASALIRKSPSVVPEAAVGGGGTDQVIAACVPRLREPEAFLERYVEAHAERMLAAREHLLGTALLAVDAFGRRLTSGALLRALQGARGFVRYQALLVSMVFSGVLVGSWATGPARAPAVVMVATSMLVAWLLGTRNMVVPWSDRREGRLSDRTGSFDSVEVGILAVLAMSAGYGAALGERHAIFVTAIASLLLGIVRSEDAADRALAHPVRNVQAGYSWLRKFGTASMLILGVLFVAAKYSQPQGVLLAFAIVLMLVGLVSGILMAKAFATCTHSARAAREVARKTVASKLALFVKGGVGDAPRAAGNR